MSTVSLEKVYKPSDEIVARKIEGEFIIVPLTAGIGDMEDDLFSLDEVGLVIWERLDGKTTLAQIVEYIASEYDAEKEVIEKDVQGFVGELVARRMLVEV
ncbi:PqqD family protein [Methanocella sp. MCL-LM]|uniref:PqqD family protein n=1 Tax=Methanocella sp. MCL-LM TaxID=3412035 RepID=UPI003C75E14C